MSETIQGVMLFGRKKVTPGYLPVDRIRDRWIGYIDGQISAHIALLSP